MKKILFITTISGFLQQFEMNDVHILQEAGFEIHYASNFHKPVYCFNKEAMIRRGIRLHQIDIEKSPLKMLKNTKAFFQLKKLVREEGIRCIHCHNPMGGVLGRLLAPGRKIYTIYTAHGFHFYKGASLFHWLLFFPAEYLLARFTNCLITINEEDFKRARYFRMRKDAFIVKIPGVGVNTEKFLQKEGMREQVRRELGISEDIFYILSVGELNANKNHKVVMEAIARMQDKRLHYGICGRGVKQKKLLKAAMELGIEEQVTLFGFRTDIPRMLAAADCFAFPSKREGLGIAAIEAMAAGLPLLTSDCRGTREYVRDGENGIVCKKNTVSEYIEAIAKLKGNPLLCRQMSACSLRMAKHFDIRQTDQIMRAVYQKIT